MKKKLQKILKLFLPYGFIVLQKKYKKHKDNKKKEYVFDAIFSVGDACRPAYYLKQHDLRLCANPLDWMMSYSLDTVVHLYQSKFNDFFIDFIEDQQESHWFIDIKNNITSIHYKEIGDDNKTFNRKMKKRFMRANKRLLKASNICFISNRNENSNVFSDFLNKMGNIYPGKITLINIFYNNEIDGIISPIKHNKKQISERLELIQYEFNDIHPNGNDINSNPNYWIGNVYLWNKIIEQISIKKNFISYLLKNYKE
ncbi:DUF1796 family putative cysteine peptidase [Flavobacterium sp. JAS]|uniref:DUF1796 family putative cysteine peptidase n=1 Tax=Flavobacterium sp. JAS TaxID=2897329 RepID=UPI001E5258DE|nr:DUF1796 family putative cysteine peptidase [Flavobacterium sp. JAS]MCD0469230.1 papain-like cysteine peptidase [Flavobacterium sp. JAS]